MRKDTCDPTTGTMEIPLGVPDAIYWLEVGQEHGDRSFAVPDGARVVVGTSPSCDVVLRDRTVSSRHCEIACTNGLLWVRDLNSKNGLYAGGARVARAQLRRGASFAVGRVPIAVGSRRQEAVDEPLPGVIGTSAAMQGVASQVRKVARLSVPVLIRGATGSGKEVIARALHRLSPRAREPFEPINIGAMPASLAAAELFGHDRGAFTGAAQHRRGAFVAAYGGTLFLDEIGEASPEVQVHLLRALEQREVQPLGSDRRVRVNVRVVAATWVELEGAVKSGRFRQDLFHRLAVGTIHVPPLSERRTDIGLLATHVLSSQRSEVGDRQLTPSAVARLMAHDWPGNVRELNNVVIRAALNAQQCWINAGDVDAAFNNHPRGARRMSPAAAQTLVASCGGNVTDAAHRAGVPRSTFRGWLANRRK